MTTQTYTIETKQDTHNIQEKTRRGNSVPLRATQSALRASQCAPRADQSRLELLRAHSELPTHPPPLGDKATCLDAAQTWSGLLHSCTICSIANPSCPKPAQGSPGEARVPVPRR